jgi:ribosomal protein L1
MDEDALNISIRKFLKHFGVTAQREIENAVRRGVEEGKLRGDETVPVRATLVVEGLLRDFQIEGVVTLAAQPPQ